MQRNLGAAAVQEILAVVLGSAQLKERPGELGSRRLVPSDLSQVGTRRLAIETEVKA